MLHNVQRLLCESDGPYARSADGPYTLATYNASGAVSRHANRSESDSLPKPSQIR